MATRGPAPLGPVVWGRSLCGCCLLSSWALPLASKPRILLIQHYHLSAGLQNPAAWRESLAPPSLTLLPGGGRRTECLSLGLPPAGQESSDNGEPKDRGSLETWGALGQEETLDTGALGHGEPKVRQSPGHRGPGESRDRKIPWTRGTPEQGEPRDTGSRCFPCLQRVSVDFRE